MIKLFLIVCVFAHTGITVGLPNEREPRRLAPIINAFRSSQKQCSEHDVPAWTLPGFEYPAGVHGLHTEIEHFYEYTRQNEIELTLREKAVTRTFSLVKKMWPNVTLAVMGSYPNKLAILSSDIDMIILGVSNSSRLQILQDEVMVSDIAEPNSIVATDYGHFEMLEFIDRESRISIDLIINKESFLEFSEITRKYITEYPALPKLIIIVKQYLKLRGLNNVHTGGIQSTGIYLMCINFFQNHVKSKSSETLNLGNLLLKFFKLFGRDFDYENTAITTRDGEGYLPRKEVSCGLYEGFLPYICIEDPTSPPVNFVREVYRGFEVKQALDDAYTTLLTAISSARNSTEQCRGNSILSHIIRVPNDLLEYRKWVNDTFGRIVKTSTKS